MATNGSGQDQSDGVAMSRAVVAGMQPDSPRTSKSSCFHTASGPIPYQSPIVLVDQLGTCRVLAYGDSQGKEPCSVHAVAAYDQTPHLPQFKVFCERRGPTSFLAIRKMPPQHGTSVDGDGEGPKTTDDFYWLQLASDEMRKLNLEFSTEDPSKIFEDAGEARRVWIPYSQAIEDEAVRRMADKDTEIEKLHSYKKKYYNDQVCYCTLESKATNEKVIVDLKTGGLLIEANGTTLPAIFCIRISS
ncbi:uncharacterized protein LOC135812164 [Sycon ciliatum]|uniref:uncharacterized protein LOC135812164 n=1 Tax=Sycon ciliatum TaxID=27933 RepID=UPI0031F6C3F1|eukprot:scpid66008/ scgid35209/ 